MSDSKKDQQQDDPGKTQMREPQTTVIASSMRRRRRAGADVLKDTVSFGEQQELILVVRGIIERVVLPQDQALVIGRSDARLRYHADIDLTPYGAMDRGVSREHAKVFIEDDHIYIMDLDSTNGTYISGKRLEPNTPTLLRRGDELLLGRLPVQILFK
jgi:hypothetical protein